MRASVQLPAFLITQDEVDSPSHALRAALAERLAGQRSPQGDVGPMPPPGPVMPSEAPALAIPAR